MNCISTFTGKLHNVHHYRVYDNGHNMLQNRTQKEEFLCNKKGFPGEL